MTVVTVIFRK